MASAYSRHPSILPLYLNGIRSAFPAALVESSACFIVRDGDKQALALTDVRELLGHLPKEYRAKDTWGHVAKTLDEAARGGDPVEVAMALGDPESQPCVNFIIHQSFKEASLHLCNGHSFYLCVVRRSQFLQVFRGYNLGPNLGFGDGPTMYKLLSATALVASILGFTVAANAADLGQPPPVYKAPPPVPTFSWTGFYIGGNIGAGWSQGSWTDSLFGINWSNPNNNAVFIGGGQVGGNYQIQNFVVGLEADFDWAANNRNSGNGVTIGTAAGPQTIQLSSNNRWITTVAARVGYAWDRVLLYAKGGGGWVGSGNFTLLNVGTGATVSVSNSNTNSGWLVGGGVELALTQNWTVRAEYDFLGLSNRSTVVPAGFPVLAGDTFTSNNRNVQMATVGINYLFNW